MSYLSKKEVHLQFMTQLTSTVYKQFRAPMRRCPEYIIGVGLLIFFELHNAINKIGLSEYVSLSNMLKV